MVKFICLDIDGTLLNSNHEISEKNKAVIKEVTKVRNIPVILVSARMPKGINFLQEQLDIHEPIICYSGSLILDKEKNILFSQYIDNSYIKDIVSEAKNLDIHISLYKDDNWYVEQLDYWALQEKEITNIEPNVVEYTKLLTQWKLESLGCNKLLCMGASENIQKLRDILLKRFDKQLNIYLSKPTYLEIMPKNASKTLAISFLLDRYNIEKSELMTVGDNYNDMDMLEYAAFGIAMGNAPIEVKNIAKDITLTNDEDGVAWAIEKYVL
ncbi:Cof-type HAD-IIB family hydrolase [Clostridium manihotivorum]|uniref:Cof-type HAD-IIB family hydrolase n=1 Tax=Clostridium manihotivorum TaxID=2320868 RepID=A0A410DZA5_9CLOT|nr:Cof-type HAD-IIB family hydrolase [Clostridium manihotivorum]QAA34411.1 Cof-type HAD-IIB family hydrolase [Clostridium manihotivorum]